MAMPDIGKEVLLASDDRAFCDLLLHYCARDDSEEALHTLFDPLILERLQQIKTSQPAVFFGSFLGPLKRLYPRQIFPGDLFSAMAATAWDSNGTGGDLAPEAFVDAGLAYYAEGGKPGVHPGWITLAQHYTVRQGEFTVVTGIASHQKTTFVQAMCVNLARERGYHFGIFSPEQHPSGQMAQALAECYTGLSMAAMPIEMYRDALVWVATHFHPIIAPDEVAPTLPWILGVARQQAQLYTLHGVVIDPFNEVDHQIRGYQSETLYISECLSKIRRFCRSHNIHCWVVAHPTKMQKAVSGPYKDKYPPPTPYDIASSAHWYNKPDNCLCVWRDVGEDSNRIEVHVQKVRNRSVGRPGMVELTYNHGRFDDAPDYAETPSTRYGRDA